VLLICFIIATIIFIPSFLREKNYIVLFGYLVVTVSLIYDFYKVKKIEKKKGK